MNIWKRFLIKKLLLTYLFFLFSIFAIYILVDLSVHGVKFFHHGNAPLLEALLYYFGTLSTHLDLLSCFSFLLALIQTLYTLSVHNEWLALQTAGISSRLLLRPYFLFSVFLSCLSLFNAQVFTPVALDSIDSFRSAYSKKNRSVRDAVQSVTLDDESELVYHRFSSSEETLYDLFWIRSPFDIWHIQSLHLKDNPPIGCFADHLVRREGLLQKSESYEKRPFAELPIDPQKPLQRFIPFNNRPLLTLLTQTFSAKSERASLSSRLHYKLALPLLPILLFLGVVPYPLLFTRNRRPFLIVLCALFLFFGLYTILDGMFILAENQVLPAPLALYTPFLIAFPITWIQLRRLIFFSDS
jgi:lipopolysaccharide export LptBFGC system permease protein LptF